MDTGEGERVLNSDNSDCESINKSVIVGTKKRKYHGRCSDVMKKIRLCTHETGPDCECKRLKCFQRLSRDNIKKIINDFNSLSSYNEQSLHLAGLINIHHIKNRRPRKDENEAKFHGNAYTYKVRIHENDQVEEVPICYRAFLSLHGVSAIGFKIFRNLYQVRATLQ